MPSSQPMTEMVVFHLQEGVNLENLTSSNPSLEAKTFVQLTTILKTQQGFIRQFWVPDICAPLVMSRLKNLGS